MEVNRSDYERYLKTHETENTTDKTGFSLLIRILFHEYMEVCENPGNYDLKSVDMKSLANAAARKLKEDEE